MRKLCDPASLEALRKASAVMRETGGGLELGGESETGGESERGGNEFAGAMLADLAADVVGNDSRSPLGW